MLFNIQASLVWDLFNLEYSYSLGNVLATVVIIHSYYWVLADFSVNVYWSLSVIVTIKIY